MFMRLTTVQQLKQEILSNHELFIKFPTYKNIHTKSHDVESKKNSLIKFKIPYCATTAEQVICICAWWGTRRDNL